MAITPLPVPRQYAPADTTDIDPSIDRVKPPEVDQGDPDVLAAPPPVGGPPLQQAQFRTAGGGFGKNDKPVEPVKPQGGGFGSADKLAPPPEPTWAQTVIGAGSNLGKSFVKNVLQPGMDIVNPIGAVLSRDKPGGLVDQAKGVANLGRSVAAFAPGDEGTAMGSLLNPEGGKQLEEAQKSEQERAKKVLGGMWDYYKNRYGSVSGFKKALRDDPLSVAFDASIIVSAGETAAARAARLAGKVLPEAATKAIGSAAEKAGQVATRIAKSPLDLETGVTGHLSGQGYEAARHSITAGYKREREYIDTLAGRLPLEGAVKDATKAVQNMRNESFKQYQAGLKLSGLKDVEQIDFNKVLQGWQDAQERGHFEGEPIKTTTEGLDKQLLGILDRWWTLGQSNPKFFSGEGMDALKRKIGGLLDNIPQDRQGDRAYIGDLYNVVKDQIVEQAPVYAKVMKNSREAMDAIDEIERALKLKDKSTYDSGVRALLSAFRNNAYSNNRNRMRMVDELERHGAKGLKSRLAGSMASSAFPRGLAGRNPIITAIASLMSGHPEGMLALPAMMPNVVGRTNYALGSLGRSFEDIAKGIGPVIPKGAAIQSVERAAESQNGQE